MITYYQSNRILDKVFGNVNFTVPSTMYLGLSTTVINDDGSGVTEPVGGSYARVAVTNDKTVWGDAANGVLVNLSQILFAESTVSWGTITYVFLADAISSGNILYFDVLNPSKIVQANTTVIFAPSAISIRLTNA